MLDPIDRTTESELFDAIDPDRLEAHVDAFVGLDRVSGTDDEWEASEYVVDRLEEYGVEADVLEYEAYVSTPEDASLTVTAPTPREVTDAITVSFGASTPPAGVHGTVVALDEITEEAVAAADLDGKVAFATGLPTPEPIRLLEEAGAAGVVFESVTEGQLHEMIVSPVWGTPGADDAADLPELPVVEIGREDGAWLRDRCDEGPVEASLSASVRTRLATLPCPVGRIDGATSDRYMIVGNHVDSWYEGITDNATAMAATLEIARVVAESDVELRRGLLFGFWSAHSTGRYAGSAWYADEHWTDLRRNAVCYLHLDLNGLVGADGIWYQHMAELEAEHLDAIRTATSLPPREGDDSWLGSSDRPARNSDQSFWGVGASSLLSGARLDPGTEEGGPIGGGWWWHTPEDTRDKVDVDVLVEETRLYLALVSRICGSPVLPHDYTATVDDVRDAVDEIEATADGAVSFDDVRDRLDDLRGTLERVNDVIDARGGSEAGTAAAAEDLQVALGNELIPALYMRRPDYEHEPALSHALLPSLRPAAALPDLDGRDRRFAEVTVRRARNRLVHRLERAAARADRFLAAHD